MAIEGFKLTEKDREDLQGLEHDIKVVESDLKKAEEVGIDVTTQRAQIKQLRTTRDGLLKQFSR